MADLRAKLYARWARLVGANDEEISAENPLPVKISPSSGGSVQETLQEAVVIDGDGTAIDMKGFPNLSVQVAITNTATVTFEATMDGEATWHAVAMVKSTQTALTTGVTSTTSSGLFRLPQGYALDQFRARVSGSAAFPVVTVISRKYPG
jgi:hypothetical protein